MQISGLVVDLSGLGSDHVTADPPVLALSVFESWFSMSRIKENLCSDCG